MCELMHKIYNNVTIRSNVFAVWLTVGFFEVISPPGAPIQFGQEIGRADGRNIRRRMFAVIDRSTMKAAIPGTLATNMTPIAADPMNPQTVPLNIVTGTSPLRGRTFIPPPQGVTSTWEIRTGSRVRIADTIIGPPNIANSETITVVSVNPNATPPTLTAIFTLSHLPGKSFSFNTGFDGQVIPGNPGPQPNYDHRKNGDVVLHYSIIQ